MLIEPHGGKLINKVASKKRKEKLLARAGDLPKISLKKQKLIEIENIALGLYSPLEGFMTKQNYLQVVEKMQLTNQLLWPIPIVLDVNKKTAEQLTVGNDVALSSNTGEIYGILHLEDKYTYNKKQEAKLVYKTTELEHPGVNKLYHREKILLGGPISLLKRVNYNRFNRYRLTPREVRSLITDKGWTKVVGFQTRNPLHRAHEYIQKCALEICDGLLLTPLVGETKSNDLPVEYRIKSYEVVKDKIYPPQRVKLVVFPAAMRYAGPREAVFHALCRQNYGCTHFIVGRDHAGVGDYYGTYEAQKLFDQVDRDKLGIEPVCFDYAFYCKKCRSMATKKTCPHAKKFHSSLSGTKIRQLLREGEKPPKELIRSEVAEVLIQGLTQ